MYDMYRWDQAGGPGDGTAAPVPGRRSRTTRPGARRPAEAARAVQESLDRRDNGGDPAVPRQA